MLITYSLQFLNFCKICGGSPFSSLELTFCVHFHYVSVALARELSTLLMFQRYIVSSTNFWLRCFSSISVTSVLISVTFFSSVFLVFSFLFCFQLLTLFKLIFSFSSFAALMCKTINFHWLRP